MITTVKGLCKMTRSFDSAGYCFTFEWALWSFQALPSPLASCCLGLNRVPVVNFCVRNVEDNVESLIQGVVLGHGGENTFWRGGVLNLALKIPNK